MGRKGSGLTEQRLVPFQASRHVAYPYDRPRALHRVPLCGLILVTPTWIQPVMDGLGDCSATRIRVQKGAQRERCDEPTSGFDFGWNEEYGGEPHRQSK